MQFELATSKLNTMLGKVEKGVGNGKILAVTAYLHLKLEEGMLFITSTNLSNYVTVMEKVEGQDGEAVVKADQLIQLAKKTTTAQVKIELVDNTLVVKGNGTYKLPILENAEYPTYEFNTDVSFVDIEVKNLLNVFNINKSSISSEMVIPYLTGYNVGENCVTTDSIRMTIFNQRVLSERVLISQELADLLKILDATKGVRIQHESNKLLFTTDNTIVFGTELDGIENYPDINALIQSLDYDATIKVKRNELLAALDRLSIFVDVYDNNGVKLAIAGDTLKLTDLKQNSSETLKLTEPASLDVVLTVNINYLTSLVSVLSAENTSIFYGDNSSTIKIIGNENITQVLSLMSTEE
jgi:DNA polymerase III sliding clamp (beta) subunit (PCNA family)